MIEQINLFAGPAAEAEIRFVKLNKKAITPTKNIEGDWIIYAPEDILLQSDQYVAIYSALRILVDDDNVEVRVFSIKNELYYPRENQYVTINRGHNTGREVGMYMRTRYAAPKKEIFPSAMWDFDYDSSRGPEYETIMEKKVMLLNGQTEDYKESVPKNSVLIKRGDPVFILQAYRRASVTMVEEFVKSGNK